MGPTKFILMEIFAFFMPFSVFHKDRHKDRDELNIVDGCWVSMVFYWLTREPGMEKVNLDNLFSIIKESIG